MPEVHLEPESVKADLVIREPESVKLESEPIEPICQANLALLVIEQPIFRSAQQSLI